MIWGAPSLASPRAPEPPPAGCWLLLKYLSCVISPSFISRWVSLVLNEDPGIRISLGCTSPDGASDDLGVAPMGQQ